jgi:fatty-acyl-CoA synthase
VVVGVPDKAYGEEVCACIIPKKEAAQLTPNEKNELTDKAKAAGLGSLYRPRYVLIWDNFPLNANQKLDRKQVKRLAVEQVQNPCF